MLKGRNSKWLMLGMVIVLLLPLLLACGEEGDGTPTIKLGIGYPKSTEPGMNGIHMAEMAAEEINEAGGVDVGGVMHDIELVIADTNEMASGADAAAAVERLISVNGIDFFIGTNTSDGALPVMEVLADQKMLGIISTSSTDATQKIHDKYDTYKYVFTSQFSPTHSLFTMIAQVLMIGNELRAQTKIEVPKVALVFQKGPAYDPVVPALKIMLPKFNFEVIGDWRPDPNAVDLTAELQDIQASGAQIILQAISGSASIVISRQWGELEIPAVLGGINFIGGETFWDATGGYCNYQVQVSSAQGGVAVTPKTIPFMEKLVEKYGEAPAVGVFTYDMVYVLADAIERAGTLDKDAVIVALEDTDYTGAFGRWAFYGLEGEGNTHRMKEGPGYVFFNDIQWRDGKLVCVWPDGNPVPGYDGWEGVRFEGTQDFVLPPWVITEWNK